MFKHLNTQKGFTLVEILVSVSIFSLVITMTAGLFISGLREQRRSLQVGQLLSQMSYTMEYMSRALRMAKKDDLEGVNCLTGEKVNYEITRGGRGIRFRNYRNQCQEFFLGNNILKESRAGHVSELTSGDLRIEFFRINSYGWQQAPHDILQPRVTLFLKAKPVGQEFPKLQLQTTISQRSLDVRR